MDEIRARPVAALARLNALEWCHDGPLPADALALLDATMAGLAARAAAADGILLDRLSRDATRGLAMARHDTGTGTLADLDTTPLRLRMPDARQAALRRRAAVTFPA